MLVYHRACFQNKHPLLNITRSSSVPLPQVPSTWPVVADGDDDIAIIGAIRVVIHKYCELVISPITIIIYINIYIYEGFLKWGYPKWMVYQGKPY